ncbi:MAG: hypothetical protein ABR503_13320, partial [Chitinophagaceae bacterium]
MKTSVAVPVLAFIKSFRSRICSFPLRLSFFSAILFFSFFYSEVQAQCPTPITNNSIVTQPAVCAGGVALLRGSTPSGGNGTYTYLWEMNPDIGCGNNGFIPIPGATGPDYIVPASDDPRT